MAATRLIALHINKGKTVAQCLADRTDYTENVAKTEDGKYISAYACDAKTCDEEFLLSKRQYEHITGRTQAHDVIAYQIRQSFKPGEITPEEANKVGYETAMRFTKGKHAFIVATHVDRAHIHNHIIFNSTTLDCTRKFRDFRLSGLALARLSDIVCLEHRLSVIIRKPYGERQKRTEYPEKKSQRDEICEAIDAALARKPKDFRELIGILQEAGYAYKDGKQPALRGKGHARFARFRSLGKGYSVEELCEVIAGNAVHKSKFAEKTRTSARSAQVHQKSELSFLIDVRAKMQAGKGAGYARWAKVFNLKQMAKAMMFMEEHGIKSYAELKEKADGISEKCDVLLESVKADEARDNFDLERYLRFGVTCPECHKPAYPSRFITICENGHMDDFPWSWWVHRGMTNCKGKLKMYSTGNTSTLADMWIECELCGAKRSMSGATQEDNFSELRCSGHHPFRPRSRNERCDKKVIPSQRGASNVYFSVSRSAISIPPWVNPLYNLIDEHLHDIELLKDVMGDDGVTAAYNKYFADNYTRTEFDEALTRRLSNITEFKEIKQMEYDAITHHNDPAYASNKKHFKAEEDSLPAYLKPYFSRVIRITRLREVKVLLGFTRVDAPDPDADVQANVVYLNKGKSEKWLPAAEVNGEGVFIEFNKETLEKWLAIPSVKALSRRYEECYEEFCNAKGWTLNVKRNATYVLMHTFAHLLIKQMSMTSGYSSSAIRERIYFSEKMTGILLYTGSADKEGSLGGLVELGNIGKLVPLMKDAFQEALLCTNDPECMSNAPAGNNLNGAACHSCCMISETACENGNRMLDRGLVVPIACRERESYFRELVCELCQLEM